MPNSTELTRQQALNAAAGAAAKRLKEAHLDEYNSYYAEEAAARGHEWTPRPTPEQRAEQEFARLLAEHPHLADSLRREKENAEA